MLKSHTKKHQSIDRRLDRLEKFIEPGKVLCYDEAFDPGKVPEILRRPKMQDQKIAIRVHSPEQSECVQKMAESVGYKPLEDSWCDNKYTEDGCYIKFYPDEIPRVYNHLDVSMVVDSTILDFDTDGKQIREFFAKKDCPECGLPLPRDKSDHKAWARCMACGGDVSVECYDKCEKVPFEKIGGINVFWRDNGLQLCGEFTDIGKGFSLFLTKEMIRQAFEYYATPTEIETLYMEHCVSDEPVDMNEDFAIVVRHQFSDNQSIPADVYHATKRRNVLNRFLKNGVKR
jgi:hypothetical protein